MAVDFDPKDVWDFGESWFGDVLYPVWVDVDGYPSSASDLISVEGGSRVW
jgi:hypothetical protein